MAKIKKIKEEKEDNNNLIKRKLYAKTNSNAGARSKFEQFNAEIIERTRAGASVKDRIGGLIVPNTYWEWMKAGEEDLTQDVDTQYSDFSRKIKEAENEYRRSLIECIKNQAPQDWRAANWLLERSDPETYKLRDKMDVKQEIEVSQKALLEVPDNGDR